MAKQNFKTMKVFDCQDMPKDVKEAFLKYTRSGGHTANDCYVELQRDKEAVSYYKRNKHSDFLLVHRWLTNNGAKEHEDVIIGFNW